MVIRLNTQFNPFTYDELVKPLRDYKETYDKVEEAYSTLAEQTEAFKDEASRTNSPEAYEMYKGYSDALRTVTDDFSHGMTAKNRAQLLNMRKRYAREIKPIANASEARDKANTYRMEVKAKNPGAVFEVDEYNSLDPFLHGGRANNNYVDTNQLMTKAAAEFEALGKAMFSKPEYRKIANGYELQVEQLNGMPAEQLMAILADPANANTAAGKAYRQIYDKYIGSVGIDKYSQQGQNTIIGAIQTGAMAGLAKPTYQHIDSGLQAQQANARGWASIDLQRGSQQQQKNQFNAQMKMKGYNADGTPDQNSPYWTMMGVTWEDGKPQVGTKPSSRGDNDSNGGGNGTPKAAGLSTPVSVDSQGRSHVYSSDEDLEDGLTAVNYDEFTEEERTRLTPIIGDDLPSNYTFYRKPGSTWSRSKIIAVPKKIRTTTRATIQGGSEFDENG